MREYSEGSIAHGNAPTPGPSPASGGGEIDPYVVPFVSGIGRSAGERHPSPTRRAEGPGVGAFAAVWDTRERRTTAPRSP